MANPTCTRAALNSGCLSGNTLNDHQRKALRVWFKACELKGIGGTDYTSLLTNAASGGLLYDTIQLVQPASLDDMQEWMLTILQNAAVASGGTTAQGIQTLMQNIKCLNNVDEDTLDRMLLLLECRLGVHKSYPQ